MHAGVLNISSISSIREILSKVYAGILKTMCAKMSSFYEHQLVQVGNPINFILANCELNLQCPNIRQFIVVKTFPAFRKNPRKSREPFSFQCLVYMRGAQIKLTLNPLE